MMSLTGIHGESWDAVLAAITLLSQRELEVFGLLGEGASNRTISSVLAISERTAKAHVAQILAKLDVESRLQAGIVAFAWEVVTHNGDARALPSWRSVPRCGPAAVVRP
ncbi:helix-turn-helix transcriptional regulator [Streptomyces sp. NPDC097640]|uniref:response regulator transcription factor n=1 Tax=Streptomyces sp. NPDC097640 TaxID=3157229 RepID=UPI003323DB44